MLQRSKATATRASEVFASYFPNRLCIRLPKDVSIVDEHLNPRDDISNEDFSVFFHEYVHYLQNLSTISGAMGYVLYSNLLALFSAVLDHKGRSLGAKGMDTTDQGRYRDLLAYWDHMDGDAEPESLAGLDVASLRITKIVEGKWAGSLRGEQVSCADVSLECTATLNDGSTRDCAFALGTLAIEEGVAYELDRLVALGPDGHGDGGDDAPAFPYHILRAVGLHTCGKIDRICLVACAVSALHSVDPPQALLSCLKDYRQRRDAGDDAATALGRVLSALESHRTTTTKTLTEHDLPEVAAMFAARGTAEVATQYITQVFCNLLSRRLSSPIFELSPFSENKVNIGQLNGLVHGTLPCDAIQEREGDDDEPERDLLLSFGPKKNLQVEGGIVLSQSDVLRPLQAQLEFVLAHLGEDGFLTTAEAEPSPCPFYSCCSLEYRKNNPSVCKSRPWETYVPGTEKTCWYGLGVASTLGTVSLKSVDK